jgi:hypothetical protein
VKFDKSPSWLVELFQALQPEVGGVPRKMFGYPCAQGYAAPKICLSSAAGVSSSWS